MQPIGSMLRRTTHHVTRQRELFALRTRKAGTSFAVETRSAGRELASAVRAEADAWSKYVRESTSALGAAVAPVSLERTLLERVAGALRAMDQRVRQRMDRLEGRSKRARSTKAKRTNGAAHVAAKVSRREASASRPRARAS